MNSFVLLTVLLAGCTVESFIHKTCDRDYKKIGCFIRQPSLFPAFILTAREKNTDFSTSDVGIDWSHFSQHLHSFACQCAEKVKDHYKYFAIGFYGECHAGNDVTSFESMLKDQSKKSGHCIGGNYKACNDTVDTECSGIVGSEYVYSINPAAPKAIDGGYSDWSKYTTCDKTCGDGTQVRERQCTNPPPNPTGKDCTDIGDSTESKRCKVKECPVDGGFTDWSAYSKCDRSCGGGSKTRTRTCTNPQPAFGGKLCEGDTTDSVSCNNQPCPIDGGFTDWSDYNECDKSCGGGSKTRTRTCTNPEPAFGGNPCIGELIESKSCNSQECPINGGLSTWTSYGSCNKVCGGGSQTRTRSCTNPSPAYGGKGCTGATSQTKSCNTHNCPRNGGLSTWTSYGSCNKVCGGGSQTRTRSCTNPSPAYGGKGCTGATSQTRSCNRHNCPRNGGLSSWSSYGSCSKICGGGVQKRTRSCTNPSPAWGGRGCSGSTEQTRSCNTKLCLKSWSCSWKYTNYNNEGKGKAHYLDRHHLSCGQWYGINYFKLQRNGRGKYRYKYKCCSTQLPCTNRYKANDYTYEKKGDAVYLDRQRVQCSDQYLSSFRLSRNSAGNNFRYLYNCCEMSHSRSCYTSRTGYTYDGDGNAVYFDRQTVSCNSYYSLTMFKLERNSGHNKWRYHYRCCKTLQP